MHDRTEAWSFRTKRFAVKLYVERDWNYKYDGDDESGETQAKLDCGEYVAFDSRVVVYLDGHEIGSDSLGGSVYDANEISTFYAAHRDPNPLNRNCTIMRRAWRGLDDPNAKVSIGHYFPDMVRQAIADARSRLLNAPYIRAA